MWKKESAEIAMSRILKDFRERGKSAQGRKGGKMEKKRKVMRERLLVEVWVRVLRAPAAAG